VFRKLLFFILIIFIFSAKTSYAQNSGISVTPSITHIDLATDPSEYQITYANNTNADITLLLGVKDFTALEDSYKIEFLTPNQAENYKYSLSSWISFSNKSLQLSPKETKTVTVFIDKTRITKGGHYASILAQIVEPNNNKNVNIKAVLTSLLFVRADTGQEIESGNILNFNPLQTFIEYPSSYRLRFENSGNVDVVPFGLIQVYDPFGNLVARVALNQNSLDALPESIRTYDTQITTLQKILVPGTYKATIDMHFGKTDKKLSKSISFFSEGSFNFLYISVIIFLSLLIFYYKKNKTRNEKHLTK